MTLTWSTLWSLTRGALLVPVLKLSSRALHVSRDVKTPWKHQLCLKCIRAAIAKVLISRSTLRAVQVAVRSCQGQ